LVEHTTENRGVVGSIPTLAIVVPARAGHRSAHTGPHRFADTNRSIRPC